MKYKILVDYQKSKYISKQNLIYQYLFLKNMTYFTITLHQNFNKQIPLKIVIRFIPHAIEISKINKKINPKVVFP